MEKDIFTLIHPLPVYFYWHFFFSHSNYSLQISRKSSTKGDIWKAEVSFAFLKIRSWVVESIKWEPHGGNGEQSSTHMLLSALAVWVIPPAVLHVWRIRQMRSMKGAGFISLKLFEGKVMEQCINILKRQSLLSLSFSSTACFISLNHFTWCISFSFSLAQIFPACVLGAF